MKQIKNKIIIYLPCILLCAAFFGACKKDNYAVPNATLYGRVLDAGTGEVVPGSNSGNGHYGTLALYQLNYGSDNPNPINCDLHIDGTYENARIFSGSYQLVPKGPWNYTDTIIAEVNGNTEKDIKLAPWVSLTITATTVTASSVTINYTIKNNFPGTSKLSRFGAHLDKNEGVDVNTCLNDDFDNYEDWHSESSIGSIDDATIAATVYTRTFENLLPGTTYYLNAAGRIMGTSYYSYSPTISITTK